MKERNFFGKLINFSVDRYKVIYLMIALITVMGISSFIQLPKEIFPELKFPYAYVAVTYAGASPEDMEKLITTKIETVVSGVGDIKKVNSESQTGFSQTIIQFNMGVNIYDKLRKIKEEVDHIKHELPKDIDNPIIGEYDVSKMPIMQLTISGDFSRDELIDYSKVLKDEIKKVSGISKVNVSGDDPKELVIKIDPAKMSQYNISEEDVALSILDKNQDMPAGEQVLNDKSYTIRVKNSFKAPEEVEGIIVTQINSTPIFIKDIGSVDFEYKKNDAYAIAPINFKEKNEELKRTIRIDVLKKKGVNLIEVCGNVRETIDGLRDDFLIPENLEINYEEDMSIYVENSIKDVFGNAFSGLLVVIIVLFFFIDFKESLLIAFVIPMSLLIAVSLFSHFGVSINMISIIGLIISLGMLVDNAIVVVESIEAIKGKYDNIFDTVKDATGIIAAAIFSSTLTTVAAFVPLAMLKGDMGEILKQIPITVILTLSASFIVSLFITPMIASRVLKLKEKKKHSKRRNWMFVIFMGFISLYAFANNGELTTLSYVLSPVFAFAIYYKLFMAKNGIHDHSIIKKYVKIISSVLTSKKKRWGVLIVSFCVFVSSVALLSSNLIKKDNFPKSDTTSLKVSITLSGSSTIEDTRDIVLKAHEILKTKEYIKSYTATIDKHNASIFLKLPVRKKRKLHSGQISINLSKELQKIPNAKIKVTTGDEGKAASLVVRVSGKNYNDLKATQELLSSKINKLSNVEYTWTSAEGGSPQLLVTFDHRKAEMIGLRSSQMAQLIRNSIHGRKITKIKVKDKELNVMLKNDNMSINSMEDLNKIHFTNSNGTKIPFMTVASLKETIGPSTILRKDNQKVIDIYSCQ